MRAEEDAGADADAVDEHLGQWRWLDAPALTTASAVAGGSGPARIPRAVARSKRAAVGLTGEGGGMTGDNAKVKGTDDAFESK